MKPRSLLWALHSVLVFSLITATVVSAQAGSAELIVINFVGREMTFTLDGTPYQVPGTDVAPEGGKLTLTLAPGRHTYSAHVPGGEGVNGEVELSAGQSQVLGARLERTGPVISPTGIVLEEPKDALVFFEASLSPSTPPPEPQPAPLQPLPAGQGALVFVNYIGEALKIDIDGELYTVPANGRLQVNSPPGLVSYSVSAGFSGTNASTQVVAGMYTGLGFTREIPAEEPDYEVGEPVPTPVPLAISVFPVPLEDEPVVQALPTPPLEGEPSAQVGPPASPEAGQGAVNVVNYIGETLTFTIDDRTYSVAGGGGKLTLDLAPGEYTFTASTPQAAANNSLRVTAGATTQVSVALDLGSGAMQLYIE